MWPAGHSQHVFVWISFSTKHTYIFERAYVSFPPCVLDRAMAGGSASRSLELTPTWSVAIVCTLFVVISLLGERSLHHLGQWLSRTKRKPLYAALEKIKEELMLLGFISLLITITASYVSKICIKSSFFDKQRMPCLLPSSSKKEADHLLVSNRRRELASLENSCSEGHEPFISFLGLEQLHRFLFVMAVTHILYSCLTMLLAIMKVHTWIKWEEEAHTHVDNQEQLAELTKTLTLKRQSTFAAYHASSLWSRNSLLLGVLCFFRQFWQSVTKSDYLALRMGFVTKHKTRPRYDFHSYMIRSLEDEFKDIVGISVIFWTFVVCFFLFDVHGVNLFFWMSLVPIAMVLVVGAKLQYVIAKLALEDSGLSGPRIAGLKPRDTLFWFNKPRLMLHLIHFILFQDAFELATFLWVWWQFGWDSCLMQNRIFSYSRVVTGFLVQILCSYSTLPLYALVTQMGSNYKRAIFQEHIVDSIHNWKKAAKKRNKDHSSVMDMSTIDRSAIASFGQELRAVPEVSSVESELQQRPDKVDIESGYSRYLLTFNK
ncbi:MLO-like protein 11 [Selaginella moellendorffii]|nr:MLO-like protein 11 [Selaginella moellendorffii]|eukprot:XP_002989238.2 MLO-like protein 11 [Selaginella moellendorffii]